MAVIDLDSSTPRGSSGPEAEEGASDEDEEEEVLFLREQIRGEGFAQAELEHGHDRETWGGSKASNAGAYVKALGLVRDAGSPAVEIELPIRETPDFSEVQQEGLQRWACEAIRTRLPNGLNDIRAAAADRLPFAIAELAPPARCMLRGCLWDLRSRMAEANVHRIAAGKAWWAAHRIIWSLPSLLAGGFEALRAAADASEAGLGVPVEGLCRACAEHDGVLGAGGKKLLQDAKRVLRDRLRSDDAGRDVDMNALRRDIEAQLPGVEKWRRKQAAVMALASIDGVRTDLAHDAQGQRGEETLASMLERAGVARDEYVDEEEQREEQLRMFKRVRHSTPDVLFRRGVNLNGGGVVHWIDSKGGCILPTFAFPSMEKKLQRQLSNFVDLFGPGLVVWQGGFAAAVTRDLPGVRAAAWAQDPAPACPEPAQAVAAASPEASPEARAEDWWKRWQ